MPRQAAKTIVLVHGAWHGSWCWQRVVPLLEQRGITVRAVDLPSTRADPPPNADLSMDAAAVRKVIDESQGEVLLCGHSYGGMVISHPAAGAHPRVRRLIYLCAFVPGEGESLVGIRGGRNAPWIQSDEQGLTLPDLNVAAGVFYGDCDTDTQQWAIRQLRRQPAACYVEPIDAPAWRTTPSTYIVCTNDMAISEELQRGLFAPRTREVQELRASHSPFLSQPVGVAELLTRCAAKLDA